MSIENLKLPPHNLEAEKGVIGGIFIDNNLFDIINNFNIVSQDFYEQRHQTIYSVMFKLHKKGIKIDILTVSDELQKKNALDRIGGEDYLYDLGGFLLSTSGFEDYVKIVKEKSVLRNVLSTCQGMIGNVYDQVDTTEILGNLEKKIFDLTQTNVDKKLVHIIDVLEGRVELYMDIMDNPDQLNTNKVLSEFKKLDTMLGGFKPGELLILAARPAMGKTALSLNLILNAALNQKKSVAFFSLEMTKELIADRMLSTVSEIPMRKIQQGKLDDKDLIKMGGAMDTLQNSKIFIDDAGMMTLANLKSKLRRLVVENGSLDFVVIDYLQLMSGNGSKFEGNRVQEISQISRGLKELSKELGVPIIALSQLSRGVETRIDKKPQLSDLRESGSIEQDADVVIMIYREEYYDPDDPDKKGLTELLVRKNRNGSTGEVVIKFHSPTMKFKENKEDEDIPF